MESSSDAGGESQWDIRKKRINGALVHITAIFGFHLTGLVINDIVKNIEEK
jgi:tRNA A37 threonylcarbamoyladenosine dehydratase